MDSAGNLYIAEYSRIRRVVPQPYPIINTVVNAASFLPGMVPGSLATLFGKNLSPATGIEFPGAATSYKGVTVTIQSIQVPLLAVANINGQEQINFQVPFELQASSTIRASHAVSAHDQRI